VAAAAPLRAVAALALSLGCALRASGLAACATTGATDLQLCARLKDETPLHQGPRRPYSGIRLRGREHNPTALLVDCRCTCIEHGTLANPNARRIQLNLAATVATGIDRAVHRDRAAIGCKPHLVGPD
jgi:hypothetical protein